MPSGCKMLIEAARLPRRSDEHCEALQRCSAPIRRNCARPEPPQRCERLPVLRDVPMPSEPAKRRHRTPSQIRPSSTPSPSASPCPRRPRTRLHSVALACSPTAALAPPPPRPHAPWPPSPRLPHARPYTRLRRPRPALRPWTRLRVRSLCVRLCVCVRHMASMSRVTACLRARTLCGRLPYAQGKGVTATTNRRCVRRFWRGFFPPAPTSQPAGPHMR